MSFTITITEVPPEDEKLEITRYKLDMNAVIATANGMTVVSQRRKRGPSKGEKE